MSRSRRAASDLLTGEWACLGLLVESPTHGFALARELSPEGEIGRIWSLSRPLTYRAIDQLLDRGFIEARDEKPGRAGGNKTIYAATRSGRSSFRSWVSTPVVHLRDVRSELLLKLVLARRCSLSVRPIVERQRSLIADMHSSLMARFRSSPDDLVLSWRLRSTEAVLAFLDDLDDGTA